MAKAQSSCQVGLRVELSALPSPVFPGMTSVKQDPCFPLESGDLLFQKGFISVEDKLTIFICVTLNADTTSLDPIFPFWKEK